MPYIKKNFYFNERKILLNQSIETMVVLNRLIKNKKSKLKFNLISSYTDNSYKIGIGIIDLKFNMFNK